MGLFRRFWCGDDGRKGNAAILFALSLIPMLGATGAALDYSWASSNRASLQKSIDATGLALAKLMPLTQAQLDTQGWQIFQANAGQLRITVNPSDLKITTPSIGKLVLEVKGQYQPAISQVIGITNFPVGATTGVTWGIKKLEIALALDNTGSMASNNKMTELKTASHNLLNTLEQAAKNPGDVKIAIIPFHVQVKVGTANVGASWIRWDRWDDNNQNCTGSGDYRVCTPKPHSDWNGCIEDRDQNHDTLDTLPTTTSTRFPAKQCNNASLAEVMPLNYVWANLHARIDAMTPVGNTNVTIGLVWAWHALTQSEPLTEASAPDTPDMSRYIILLTDGDNTQNRFTQTGSLIDARTAAACTNIKAAGVKIYSIRVINGNADLLRNCASDPSMYFDVDSASDLNAVFSAIGGQLASLHLSQ